MRRLNIIIVNYCTPAMTIDCLRSLETDVTSQDGWHVIMVDNASGDNSSQLLRAAVAEHGWSKWVTLIESTANAGFAAGNNAGIGTSQADAYLLLNSDTIVRPGAVQLLLQSLDAHPDVGLIGPRLEWPDGSPQVSCFRNRSLIGEMVGAAGFSILDRLFPGSVVAVPVSDYPIEPQWISFACVLIRSDVIEQIGVLDDGYFMYFEDIDFARRARKAGWAVRYEPAAQVVHLRGGSSPVKESKANRNRVPRYYYESRSRYFAKWYGGRAGLLLANVFWLIGRGISWIMEVVRRREQFHCAHEARDNWTNWSNPYRRPTPSPGDRA